MTKSNKTSFFSGTAMGGLIAAVVLAGVAFKWPDATSQATAKSPVNAQVQLPNGQTAPMSFADIIDRVSPAVVSISVRTETKPKRRPSLNDIPGFEGFPFPTPPSQQEEAEPREGRGMGSGFFISSDGYVVTNNHVIEDAKSITVSFNDGRELDAKLIGTDPQTDLAVLKVDGKNFASVTFEARTKPRVGDWVIAVGNPFGLGGTATAGIVSADGRDIGGPYTDFIQIDASINRGNSGGPTFDIYGRVVGVNTAIFSPSGGSVGIGFMIPADIAAKVTKQLISDGAVSRGWLGVVIQNVTEDIAESLGLQADEGAIVANVTPKGPADKAGLQAGDVILSFNGRTVEGSRDLTRMVGDVRAGERMRLEILRSGKKRTITVKSGLRPTDAEINGEVEQEDNDTTTDSSALGGMGLELRAPTAADVARYRLPDGARGALIVGVARNSDAAQKGLRSGDLIVEASGKRVDNPADVIDAVKQARRANRDAVLLLVKSRNVQRFVALSVVQD